MFHWRLLVMALRGLQQNMLRSMLATLGVIIGVGAVVSAVSILEGAQRDILDRFETLGSDQVIVVNGSERRRHRVQQASSLLPSDANAIADNNPELIVATAPQSTGPGNVKFRERNTYAIILGTTEAYATINDYRVAEGRFLRRQDTNAMVCVLGYTVAEDLFGARSAKGQSVKINSRTFTVIGVMEERGSMGFVDVDKQVVVPLNTAMGRLFAQRHLSMLVVQCVDTQRLPACVEAAKKTLRGAHRIKAGSGDDFNVLTQEQFKKQFAQIASIFGIVLYSIAGISIVVGAIGIMNIMLVSVTERTREIGVRIAVGARRMDILKQFLTEASIISSFGGVLGVVCGWAISNFLSAYSQDILKTYTPPTIIVVALVMACMVGIVSGIYPAIRASRLDPVTALRFE